MRYILILAVLAATVLGCARDVGIPTLPDTHDPSGALQSQSPYDLDDGPYRLWGEWTFFFNAEHDRVDVVPRRQARFHLNALKFLEEYCTDCLQITNIDNNGDGTIDLTVQITHPFPGMPQFTGFDVKGIIMFNGSYEFPTPENHNLPLPSLCYISWRELGDPEVINPDGYTYRWSPVYESGSNLPIFNYWEGKFASGVPNAGLNAYLNFYSDVERHMFRSNTQVTRTYRIWLPPGEPVVAGYAIEACWEPPTVTPVTNPVEDFPITANQTEPYHFKMIFNNGEPILEGGDCCGKGPDPCSDLRLEVREWDSDWGDENHTTHITWYITTWSELSAMSIFYLPCDDSYGEDVYRLGPWNWWDSAPGRHRDIICVFDANPGGNQRSDGVFDLLDYTIIED